MGAISRWFNKEPVDSKRDKPGTKTVTAELPPEDDWIKVNGKYTFWYKTTKVGNGDRINVEAKVFIENGIEKSVDLATGSIVSKKYADYDHYFYGFSNEEEAGRNLLSRVANSVDNRYNRGDRKRVYLD